MKKMRNNIFKIVLVLLGTVIATYFVVCRIEVKNDESEDYMEYNESIPASTNSDITLIEGFFSEFSNSSYAVSKEGFTILNCDCIYQNPTLPNGCEITSAAIVLQYLGYNVNKETLSDNYLDKKMIYYQANPDVSYIGEPRSTSGWYCFPPVIEEAINEYFSSNEYTKHVAKDCTGLESYQIREYVDKGFPIICWTTLRWQSPERSSAFILSNNILPYSNLHCVVISGYYISNSMMYYRITDPIWGIYDISEAVFEKIYKLMGNRSVVVTNNQF